MQKASTSDIRDNRSAGNGGQVPFSSNCVRLSPGGWLVAAIVLAVLFCLAPVLWERAEKFEPDPDYRLPLDLSKDYWLYNRYCRWAASKYETLVIGDSVIWGNFVSKHNTLSHYLNEIAGRDEFANLGMDGVHPVALSGLLKYYGRDISGKNIILHLNPLWMSSEKSDLQSKKEFGFYHPGLVPQFIPNIPCYKDPYSKRFSAVVERYVPFLSLTSHLKITYFESMNLPTWTLEHPYENPASAVTLELPASANNSQNEHISWIEKGTAKSDFQWVKLETSLQWNFFKRSVELLKERGNSVFVLVGPFNEHMLKGESIEIYRKMKSKIEDWLRQNNIAYYMPPALPGELYVDASHPMSEGYAMLAEQLFKNESFKSSILCSSCDFDSPVTVSSGAKAKKVVFIAGTPSHGQGNHEWDKDARFLKQSLNRAANIKPLSIDIHYNGWPENSAALDDADAVVFLSDGREHHPLKVPDRLAKIRELAGRGVGLAFLHYAVDPPEGAEADFLEWMGGCYERGYSQNPINTVKVSPVKNNHPICRGCQGYVAEDEWYFDIRFRPDDRRLVPIMTGKLPPRNPKDKVLAWAVKRKDGGRGFGFTGGHYHKNWHMEPFRKLVLNAILWVAKEDVPENGVASAQPWRFVSIPDFLNVDLTYPQPGWEDTLDYVLKAIKAENPEFVLVAGDLVMGRWPDKDSIKKYAAIYYPAWVKRMQDHELKFYTAIGDHEIGDNPWHGEKAALVPYFKRRFQQYLKMPLNGPLRMRGTAFWFVHENTLFISVDVFEKGSGPQGQIVTKVTGPQLEWLEQVIADNPGVEHIIVMGHTPILGPVAKESSSGLMLEGAAESPLWQALKKHRVALYLCGEVHAITCTQADGILQIAHGGLFGYNSKVNYLVGTVFPHRIELQLKEISIINRGQRLWQVGDNRPHETVLLAEDVKERGFVTVGTATLNTEAGGKVLKHTTGHFDCLGVNRTTP